MNDLNLARELLNSRRYITKKYFCGVVGAGGTKRWIKLLKDVQQICGGLSTSAIKSNKGLQPAIHLIEDAGIVNEFTDVTPTARTKSGREAEILNYFKNMGALTVSVSTVAKYLNLSNYTVSGYLRKMLDAGTIAITASPRWGEYCLPENLVEAKKIADEKRRKSQYEAKARYRAKAKEKAKANAKPKPNPVDVEALKIPALIKGISIKPSEIEEASTKKKSSVLVHINRAIELGLIVRIGEHIHTEYCVPENAEEAEKALAIRLETNKREAAESRKVKKREAAKKRRERNQNYVRTTVAIDYEERAKTDAIAITQLAKDAGEAITKKHVMESLGLFDARYRAAKALVKNVEFSRGSLGEVLITHYEASQANGGRSDKMARRNAGGTGEMIWKTPDQFDFSEAKAARLW